MSRDINKPISEIRVFYHDETFEVFTVSEFFKKFARTIVAAIQGMGGFGQ